MVQAHRSLTRPAALAAALTAAMLLSGCPAPATRPMPDSSSPGAPSDLPYSTSPSSPTTSSRTPQPPPPTRENHLSPATGSLVTQARTLMYHGDLDGASSTLDRALRIEPGNPLLWIELGRLRLAENDAHQAEGCGRKALALASGDRGAQKRAGQLLSDALRGQGRNQEAREVESRPFMQ